MSESFFIKSGNTFRVAPKESLDLHNALPAGAYTIKTDPFGNLFLEMADSFKNKGKIYGNATKRAQKILNTFGERPNTTGVMLAGEKGSGKTLLAKTISELGAATGIPTIIINQAMRGDGFNSFLQSISQPTIILFDEFEKVYDDEAQEEILTLLDGVFPSKKLFIMTVNDKWKVNKHMRNRPGRIFYMLDYKGLDSDFIVEYCEDVLNDKQYIPVICRLASTFEAFNFDMLKALVEEMNRYNEDPVSAIEMLNVKPEYSEMQTFKAALFEDGVKITQEDFKWSGNPLTGKVHFHFEHQLKKDEDGFFEDDYAIFEITDLKASSESSEAFRFSKGNRVLILEKVKPQSYDMRNFLV